MADILDVAKLHADDATLKKSPADVARYGALVKTDVLEKTVEALKANRWEVTVVPSREAALAALQGFADSEKSYFASGSTTLQQVGWTTWVKEHPEAFGTNYKAQTVAAQAKGDFPGIFAAAGKGAEADIYVTSAAAITQRGEILSGDGTGTRVNGLLRAKKLVVVASAQKIVPTLSDAVVRLEQYCLPLESARARIEYGAPGSQLTYQVTLGGAGYEPAGRRNIIIVTDEALGF